MTCLTHYYKTSFKQAMLTLFKILKFKSISNVRKSIGICINQLASKRAFHLTSGENQMIDCEIS